MLFLSIKKGYADFKIKNYQLVSLFPISGKIFERLIYNNLFEYFIENNSISQNQSQGGQQKFTLFFHTFSGNFQEFFPFFQTFF